MDKHPFYAKLTPQQRQFQLKLGLTALLINLVIGIISMSTGWYLLPILLITITLSIIAPFFDVPSLVKRGSLIYLSPLFLIEKEKNGVITMHGGTLFDYYFVIDRRMNGIQRTNFILLNYVEGLINLIQKYENNKVNNIKLKGTTYFLNERTAKKVGLSKTKTDLLHKITLIYNYFNIMISMSLSKAKWTFPRLHNINTYQGDLSELIQKKEFLIRLKLSLQS